MSQWESYCVVSPNGTGATGKIPVPCEMRDLTLPHAAQEIAALLPPKYDGAMLVLVGSHNINVCKLSRGGLVARALDAKP